MERKGLFKGLSIEKCWLPLIQSVVEGSNMAMMMSHNDDVEYVKIMCGVHDILETMYVDTEVMDIDAFNRLFVIWIYLLEFKYGKPYHTGKPELIKRHYSPMEVFNDIKKNWNTDIDKKLKNK